MENIQEIIQNLKDKTTAAENKIQKLEQEIEIKTQEKYEIMRNSNLSKEKRDVELLILEDLIKKCEKSREALENEIKGNNDSIVRYSMNLATLSKQLDEESSLTNHANDQSYSSSETSENDNPCSILNSPWALINPEANRFCDVANSYCIGINSIGFEEFIGYFNRGVTNASIDIPKYEWGRLEWLYSGKSNEVTKHPEIFSHIEKHLLPNGYSCQMGCKEFLKIKVPSFPDYMFVGRLDGIICQQQQQQKQQNDDGQINSKLASTFVAFEIKQILEEDTQSSSLLQLIGALIKSQYPVLHILTDMNTFTFMIYQEDNWRNTLFKYTTESYCECKTIIENWIKYAQDNRGQSNRIKKRSCDIEKKLENPQYVLISSLEKAKTSVDNDLSDDELNRLNRLEESFLSQDTPEKLNLISERNRSGPVYKVEHENKLLAMKICHVDARDHYGKMIVDDLINETNIYERLQGVDGPWPKLLFSGYIFNYNYYTIVTEFIEGRCPESEDKRDFEICYESLKKLHKLDIIHWDPRPPNFIIEANSQKAFVLNFGFSFIVEEWEKRKKVKRDFKKMKSSDGFNIKD